MFPTWYNERKQLFSRPKGFRLQDGRNGKLSVPAGQKHEQGHHEVLVDEHVPLGHFPDGAERILDNTHDGFIGLRRNDLTRRHVDVLQLRPGLHGLGHVKVHLVSVKISIVRRGIT